MFQILQNIYSFYIKKKKDEMYCHKPVLNRMNTELKNETEIDDGDTDANQTLNQEDAVDRMFDADYTNRKDI